DERGGATAAAAQRSRALPALAAPALFRSSGPHLPLAGFSGAVPDLVRRLDEARSQVHRPVEPAARPRPGAADLLGGVGGDRRIARAASALRREDLGKKKLHRTGREIPGMTILDQDPRLRAHTARVRTRAE